MCRFIQYIVLYASFCAPYITAITYKMSYDFILKTTEMTQEEKALFLGKNAERFYGFKNLISLPYIKNMSE